MASFSLLVVIMSSSSTSEIRPFFSSDEEEEEDRRRVVWRGSVGICIILLERVPALGMRPGGMVIVVSVKEISSMELESEMEEEEDPELEVM